MKIEPIIIPIRKEKKKVEKTSSKKVKVKKTAKKKTTNKVPISFGGKVIVDLDENDKPKKKRKVIKRKKRIVKRKATEKIKQLPEMKDIIKKKNNGQKQIKQLQAIEEKENSKTEVMKKQEAEWQKGPAPSTEAPAPEKYAFEPTPEERELMKSIQGEETLKPTKKEEALMEQIREPDMNKNFEPTPKEKELMKSIQGEETLKPTKKEEILMEQIREPDMIKGPTSTEAKLMKELALPKNKEDMKEKPAKPNLNRTMTGIKGIDELTHGGLPKMKAIALVGGPGTGKSMFLMQFLINGANLYNEPGIYITFEEEVDELKENFRQLNFNIEELEKKKMLKIVQFSPMKIKRFIKNMDVTLRETIKEMKAKRVVIDSLTAFTLLYDNEGKQREGLFTLFRSLKKLGVTILLSNESWQDPTTTKSGVIEFIADGVIILYNLKVGNNRVRGVEILKMRGILHESRIVPFKIMKDGIEIFTEEEVFGGGTQQGFEAQKF